MSSLRPTLRRAPAGLLVATLAALSCPVGTPAATAWAAEAALGKLDLRSEPAGAAVYVDGKFAGHTPLILDLEAGEHRVKLAKIGYLDKSRVVRLRPGETMAVSLVLTASAVTAEEAAAGRSKRKLVLLGLGALALGGGGYLVTSRNHPPVPGIIVANPYTALAAVMNVTFRADAASDRDHDPLTFEWSFGDGSRAEGRQVNHIYAEPGSYSATLAVSDGHASASAPPVAITVRGMSGVWVSSREGVVRTWTLQQSGATVTGSYFHSVLSPAQGTGSVSGALAPPNALRVTAAVPDSQPFAFEGFLDASLDRLEGRANGSGFSNTPLTFLRQ
jgi:hypothetical protein